MKKHRLVSVDNVTALLGSSSCSFGAPPWLPAPGLTLASSGLLDSTPVETLVIKSRV